MTDIEMIQSLQTDLHIYDALINDASKEATDPRIAKGLVSISQKDIKGIQSRLEGAIKYLQANKEYTDPIQALNPSSDTIPM